MNFNKTNLNKPLKFTLENEEILLHITSDIKTALQEQLETMRYQTEMHREMMLSLAEIASAVIHLADKFPEIDG